jgi:2-oxoglutarate dehydrogenase E1 component
MKEQNFKKNSFIFSANATFIQELYRKYLRNPQDVSQQWHDYFQEVGDDFASLAEDFDGASWKKDKLKVIGTSSTNVLNQNSMDKAIIHAKYDDKAIRLIYNYRKYGIYAANIDSLGLTEKLSHPTLSLSHYNFSDADLDKPVDIPYESNFSNLTPNQIITKLHKIYSNNIAYEFEYISSLEEKTWLRNKIENQDHNLSIISNEDKKQALNHLHRASSFEQMLHKKFPGAKRFSVEGGDVVIPVLEKIIGLSGEQKINNIELGMAHRGRLNVLTNICHKPYHQMIAEFKGASSIPSEYQVSGDVKYHMGAATDRFYGEHKLHISLAYNPSHLEAVNPVVLGKVRAKQDLEQDLNRKNTLPILIHGDAAFIGQGSVAETLNMSYVDSFFVGGSIHLIINNQIGFTANSNDSRSTKYCSDIAKFIEAPIIHVNGEDVNAVLYATIIAFEYNRKFSKDVVLDINCYRKYGHNEGDEPNYTQPLMYNIIKKIKPLDLKYADELIAQKVINQEDFSKIKQDRQKELEEAFIKSDEFKADKPHAFEDKWAGFTTKRKSKKSDVKTGLDKKYLSNLVKKLLSVPENFAVNPKIKKQYLLKEKIFSEGKNIDWALGESLAFASLLEEGFPVRITGQDAKRGTFSHRHSVLRDTNNEQEYVALNHLSDNQIAQYLATDSVLSEFAVLGYEYGYSLATPKTLCIWEAQFGDFANGAQIIIDQFLISGEEKWLRLSGLVLLLPHGFEGQGPEHSSARLERFLQSCAQDNMQVANCTTPANFYHILRRQLHRNYRKPLVIMSPKSLLRHKLATSTIAEFHTNTEFLPVIADQGGNLLTQKQVRKLIFCSGKVYYDLYEARLAKKINDIALVRVEELYPLPEELLMKEIKKYPNAQIIWCQEEPENMGAWNFIDRKLEKIILKSCVKAKTIDYVGRDEAASPATGYASIHKKEQEDLINKALK